MVNVPRQVVETIFFDSLPQRGV